jgi:hypothetical protein
VREEKIRWELRQWDILPEHVKLISRGDHSVARPACPSCYCIHSTLLCLASTPCLASRPLCLASTPCLVCTNPRSSRLKQPCICWVKDQFCLLHMGTADKVEQALDTKVYWSTGRHAVLQWPCQTSSVVTTQCSPSNSHPVHVLTHTSKRSAALQEGEAAGLHEGEGARPAECPFECMPPTQTPGLPPSLAKHPLQLPVARS